MVFGAITRFFTKIKQGLAKTRAVLGDALRSLIGKGRRVDGDFLDELEGKLLAADIGVAKTEEILAELQRRFKAGEVAPGEELLDFLKKTLATELLDPGAGELRWAATGPTVVLVVGVNGAGKTTSIAKLAKRYKDQGKQVLVVAGDTYRAAAAEQLTIWAGRVGVELVKQQAGADAAAVALDGVRAGIARGSDLVVIDTAGRLHNKEHLMRELEKVRRVISNPDKGGIAGCPHETLLVLDATAGQNAIQQAKVFGGALQATGIILTKLDGTAKGGAALTIKRELALPVRFIGVGEGMDDLQPFDPVAFIEAIVG